MRAHDLLVVALACVQLRHPVEQVASPPSNSAVRGPAACSRARAFSAHVIGAGVGLRARPTRQRSSVVLPTPLGPMMAMRSPGFDA